METTAEPGSGVQTRTRHKCVTIADTYERNVLCRAKRAVGRVCLMRLFELKEVKLLRTVRQDILGASKQTNKQTNKRAVNGTNGRHRCTRVRTRCAHAATTTATAPEAARPCRFGFVPNEMAPQVRTAKRCLVGVFGCLCASVFRRPSRALDPGADVAGVLPDAVQMW